jgi:predicted AAA+ superfamily ATPase
MEKLRKQIQGFIVCCDDITFINMMQNIYKQAKIRELQTNKDIKLQNIYKQAKRKYCKRSRQR